ncbi:MAG: anaerobic sulfatase maturase [Rikenellaceae bacterium]|nr:anaerobic sulfatase maturase [Rikenellaceae bacterium]
MVRKRSVTFSEAQSRRGPVTFSSMVKPVGPRCNLGCDYCYYLDKVRIYGDSKGVMDDRTLEEYVRQYICGSDSENIVFVWHGGEPLLAGIEFYRRALEYQSKYSGNKKIENTLQTNGVLLDDQWNSFFKENNFLIGVSVDGPQDIHDRYRKDKAGNPTFTKVMRGIENLIRHNVEFNTLTVVNDANESRGRDVYRFLKSIGSRFMQFLPAVEYVKSVEGCDKPIVVAPNEEGSKPASWSVSSSGYGTFLIDIFDNWIIGDVGNYYVQIFDAMLANWCGVHAGVCTLCEACGGSLVTEQNGDTFMCDHFVFPEYKLGNINDKELRHLFSSPEQFIFGLDKRNSLPAECLKCRYYFACKGECPKHRFDFSQDGTRSKYALCGGMQAFIKHIDPYMNYMRDLISRNIPPAYVNSWARKRMGFI